MSINLTREIKKEDSAVISVDVTVGKEEVGKLFDKNLSRYLAQVTIPGFRKGKAPKNVVLKKYKKNIEADSMEDLFKEAITQIVKDDNINIYSLPRVTKTDDNIDKDKDFNFKFEVDLLPTVEISDYKGLEYEKVKFTYNEEDLNKKLKELQQDEMMAVDKEDEPAKEGDRVSILYKFYINSRDEFIDEIDDETADDDDKDSDLRGPIDFIIGDVDKENDLWITETTMEKDFIDKKVDYEAEYEGVTIPDYAINEDIIGKKGKVFVKIVQIEAVDIPELDDDFAKDLDYDTLEDLRNELREELQKECEMLSFEKNSKKIIDKIINESKFEISENLIKDETEHQKKYFFNLFGFDENMMESLNKDDSDATRNMYKGFRKNAIELIKQELVMGEIIKNENLYATNEELEKKIEEYAERSNITVDKMKEQLKQNDYMNNIKRNIEIDKMNEFLIENSKATKEEEKHFTKAQEREELSEEEVNEISEEKN